MSEKKITIDTVSNEDGNELFNAICTDILKMKVQDVRAKLGIHTAQKVTTKDVITLLQEEKLKCELTVYYDPEKLAEKKVIKEVADTPAEDLFN